MTDPNGNATPTPRPRRQGPRSEPEVGDGALSASRRGEKLPSDLYTDHLEVLMGEVFDFALESFADARAEPFERVRRRLVKQAMGLTTGYAKLIETRDRHLKAASK